MNEYSIVHKTFRLCTDGYITLLPIQVHAAWRKGFWSFIPVVLPPHPQGFVQASYHPNNSKTEVLQGMVGTIRVCCYKFLRPSVNNVVAEAIQVDVKNILGLFHILVMAFLTLSYVEGPPCDRVPYGAAWLDVSRWGNTCCHNNCYIPLPSQQLYSQRHERGYLVPPLASMTSHFAWLHTQCTCILCMQAIFTHPIDWLWGWNAACIHFSFIIIFLQ